KSPCVTFMCWRFDITGHHPEGAAANDIIDACDDASQAVCRHRRSSFVSSLVYSHRDERGRRVASGQNTRSLPRTTSEVSISFASLKAVMEEKNCSGRMNGWQRIFPRH